MKTTKEFKRFLSILTIGIFTISSMNPSAALAGSNDTISYPLKEVSKLECRFKEFGSLSSNCKQDLPILKSKDYQKYANKNGGYNDFTRLYTVLWGSSYKYGWDVGNGGHMGTDIATAKGTPVYSIAKGKVIIAKNLGMLGNTVSVEHVINGKKVVSNYSHMSKINVKKGQTVNSGTKVGEVGSTGNSTGNHLHFQIDLPSANFYPAYYDYKTCPYSYYKISEEGICFKQLEKITVDPLKFVETKGSILDGYKTQKVTVNNNTSSSNNTTKTSSSIFNKTVYIGYNKNDIKEVQQIYKDLGYYKGSITGNYNDVLNSVIAYQIDKGVVASKNSNGAGRFGPKTRTQTKKDYEKINKSETTGNKDKVIVTAPKTETVKIDKRNLMTREEIEAREVKEFLKDYKIDLRFAKAGKSSVGLNKTETLKLTITNKKGRAFKGNMPGGMTFLVNSDKVSVFPKKLFYFTDGKRDIKLTGLKEGSTTLHIKVGNVTVKTFNIKVYDGTKTIYPVKTDIAISSNIVIGDKKTAIAIFKDSSNNKLINLEFGSTYKLKTTSGNGVCIKRGELKNASKIYKSSCNDNEYKEEITFTYKDTVGGLLMFDYKAYNKNFKIDILNTYNNKVLGNKKVVVTNPKGIKSNYAYKNEVIDMLEKGIVEGINKGYFQEEKNMSEKDAYVWIKNSLVKTEEDTFDYSTKNKIQNNLNEVNKKINTSSKYKNITRKDFLQLSHKYLVFTDNSNGITVDYRDLDDSINELASDVLGNNTWKDKFGKSYFQPDDKITRGEGAYFLSKLFETNKNTYLTLN